MEVFNLRKWNGSFIVTVLILCFSAFIGIGCDSLLETGPTTATNVDRRVQKSTAKANAEAMRQVGMPAIKNFAELKLAKWIYELRDNPKLMCYAYTENKMTGQFHFKGKCLGYGLPYSVQMINPEKIVDPDDYVDVTGYQYTKIPQPEPNFLYPPAGLSATFLVMLDAEGTPWPVYIESEITVSPFPLPYAVYPKGVDFFKKSKK
jgi:hypothetical protein